MRIAPIAAYPQSIQRNRNSQPSFSGLPKKAFDKFYDYATKTNGKERQMTPKSFAGLCAMVGLDMAAILGVFATCTNWCHIIGVCLGKY